MAMLTEDKTNKSSIWNQALKTIKGDSTKELVEAFTQEMTLVAEGLCEDQARLRKAVDGLIRESDGQKAKSEQDYQDVLRQIDESSRETKGQMDDIIRRLSALEKPAKKEKKGKFALGADVLSRLIVLAAIVCGSWIIVTILKIFM